MRALVIGGGRPGLELSRQLSAGGDAVRFVTRNPAFAPEIEAAGAECWIGDPDRVGTLRYALDNVTVVLWLLGVAPDPELHGPRLRMMLEKTIDTTARGIVYEGTDDGAALVEQIASYNEIPFAIVRGGREQPEAWVAELRAAIDRLLSAERGG